VGANIDTFIGNARVSGDFPEELAAHLEELKRQSQDAEEDLPTPWRFAGEILFIKPHGAGGQWRWILRSPSVHVDVGLGKLTHIVAKARLSSAFLWEHEIGTALTLLYGFLAEFLLVTFTHQVREVHLCVDVADWEISLADVAASITRSRSKGCACSHLMRNAQRTSHSSPPAMCVCSLLGADSRRWTSAKALPTPAVSTTRPPRLPSPAKTGGKKSGRATDGIVNLASLVWSSATSASVCVRLGVEEAYAFLDQIPSLWAYPTKQWLRHTIPNGDPNRARWPLSPLWQLVQQASFFCDGTPAVRERRRAGDLTLLCQMIASCSTSAAAFLTQLLPSGDDGTHFLIWFWDWFERYLEEKDLSFETLRDARATRLGLAPQGTGA
jgi:hypothetical protein